MSSSSPLPPLVTGSEAECREAIKWIDTLCTKINYLRESIAEANDTEELAGTMHAVSLRRVWSQSASLFLHLYKCPLECCVNKSVWRDVRSRLDPLQKCADSLTRDGTQHQSRFEKTARLVEREIGYLKTVLNRQINPKPPKSATKKKPISYAAQMHRGWQESKKGEVVDTAKALVPEDATKPAPEQTGPISRVVEENSFKDGLAGGRYLTWNNKTYDVPAGIVYRLLRFMWNRNSALYSDLTATDPDESVFDSEPGHKTVTNRVSEANWYLKLAKVPWSLQANSRSREIAKKRRKVNPENCP